MTYRYDDCTSILGSSPGRVYRMNACVLRSGDTADRRLAAVSSAVMHLPERRQKPAGSSLGVANGFARGSHELPHRRSAAIPRVRSQTP